MPLTKWINYHDRLLLAADTVVVIGKVTGLESIGDQQSEPGPWDDDHTINLTTH